MPNRQEADQRPRRVVDEIAPLIDAMLRPESLLKGRLIHERLVQEYGVSINYQRVNLYLQEARPWIAEELGISPGELAGLHRHFEVFPGAQAQGRGFPVAALQNCVRHLRTFLRLQVAGEEKASDYETDRWLGAFRG